MSRFEHNPGSHDAQAHGCICARLDNNHGRYAPWPPDGWWITEGCPVHHPIERAEVSTTEGVLASGSAFVATNRPPPAENARGGVTKTSWAGDLFEGDEAFVPLTSRRPVACPGAPADRTAHAAGKGVDVELTEPAPTPSTEPTHTEADHV